MRVFQATRNEIMILYRVLGLASVFVEVNGMRKSKDEVQGQMSLFDLEKPSGYQLASSNDIMSAIDKMAESEPDHHASEKKTFTQDRSSASSPVFHSGDLVRSVYAPDREFVVLSEKDGMVIAQDPKTKDTHEMAAGDLAGIRRPGLIFDMDGTIWDSSENVAASWTEVLHRHPELERQTITPSDVQSVMGKTMTYIQKEFGLSDSIMKECMSYENTYLSEHGGNLYEGLEETLKKASEIMPLYIVSNCQSGYIEAFFASSGLGKYFKDHLCFGDNNKEKDKNIRLLAKRNQITDPIYIGDIEDDYIATVAAGATFIHAAYGFGKVPEAEYRVKDIRELPELLEKIKS